MKITYNVDPALMTIHYRAPRVLEDMALRNPAVSSKYEDTSSGHGPKVRAVATLKRVFSPHEATLEQMTKAHEDTCQQRMYVPPQQLIDTLRPYTPGYSDRSRSRPDPMGGEARWNNPSYNRYDPYRPHYRKSDLRATLYLVDLIGKTMKSQARYNPRAYKVRFDPQRHSRKNPIRHDPR